MANDYLYFGYHFKSWTALSILVSLARASPCSLALFATASATLIETSATYLKGGSTGAPGLVISMIPLNECAAAPIISSVKRLASEANIPRPSPG